LLKKFSNEIIARCRAKIEIELGNMFEGNFEKCKLNLEESIRCGNFWRECYNDQIAIIDKYSKQSNRKWDFNVG